LLTLLFVFQIVAAVGLTGYLSHRNGEKTVSDMAEQLSTEMMLRVQEHLDSYFGTAKTINQINLDEFSQGLLDPGNARQLAHYFWKQGQLFRGLGTIAFAGRKGEFVGANQPEHYMVIAHPKLTGSAIRRYAPDGSGHLSEKILNEKPQYDARTRSWYQAAVQAGKPTWAGISPSVTGARLDLTAVAPYYDSKGELQGVFMTDVSLSQISSFLAGLRVGKSGQIFIMERNGDIVASSFGETPYTVVDGPKNDVRRLSASRSSSPLIAAAARQLAGTLSDPSAVPGHQRFHADIEGKHHFLQVIPYKKRGIDFLTVVVIPEADFMEHISANNRTTLLLIVAALCMAIGFGLWTSNWVVKPITKLSASAKALGEGKWDDQASVDRADEVGELAKSFNTMAKQLQRSVDGLRREVNDRRNAEELVGKSAAQNRALLSAIPDSMLVLNGHGEILDYKGSKDSGFLASSPDPVGKTVFDVMPPDTAAELSSSIAWVLQSGEVVGFDFRLIQDGEWRTYETRIVKSGEDEALSIIRDVTERRVLEEQLRHAQRMDALGTLTGGISHEFNNILSAIIGFGELLEDGMEKNHPLREYVDMINVAAKRAESLTKRLLAYSRIQTDNKELLSLNDLIRNSELFVSKLIGVDIRLDLKLCDKHIPVIADGNQLQQVILNLAANARDAMPAGGTIELKTGIVVIDDRFVKSHGYGKGGRYAMIAVSDTGSGMDEKTRKKIFDPFFTTKGVGKGTGLGLSVVYGIVKNHGGYIDVTSSPGHGTAFMIYLPLTEAEEAAA
jgi:PAS domain S-box-containing protein